MLLILYVSFCCKFNYLQHPLMQNTLKMFVKACFSLESTQALHIVQNTLQQFLLSILAGSISFPCLLLYLPMLGAGAEPFVSHLLVLYPMGQLLGCGSSGATWCGNPAGLVVCVLHVSQKARGCWLVMLDKGSRQLCACRAGSGLSCPHDL